MGIQVWFLIAPLLLASIKGEVNDNIPRYYEKPESTSPPPAPSPPPGHQYTGMKEVVLYLTSDQVKSLQAAGAIVKPFPFFEKDFLQHQYQQSGEESAERQYQPEAENKELKQEELDQYYKQLNIQQINEDLSAQHQSELLTSEKSHPKYKYSPKFRQQDYSALYAQKKANNRGKSSTIEYVRYLPNYENEELKREPYRAEPLPGYQFDTQSNIELQGYYQTEAPALKTIEDIQSSLDIKEPVMFEEKLLESTKPWTSVQVEEPAKPWEPTNGWKPVNNWEPAKIEESEEIQTPVNIQNYQNAEITSDGESLPRESQGTAKTSPQTQYASLLAPLLQLEKVSDNIAKKKEELVHYEKEIQNKLKQFKESGSHDEEKYAIELDKLNNNLVKQNVLAQMLALEISKKSQPKVDIEERLKSIELQQQARKLEPAKVNVPISKPLEIRKPQPYFVPEYTRPIPVPVIIPENTRNHVFNEEKRNFPVAGLDNVYVKVDNSYIVQKIVPIGSNREFPVKYPVRRPDEQVFRPLWEHR